jgi:hypothetical protein
MKYINIFFAVAILFSISSCKEKCIDIPPPPPPPENKVILIEEITGVSCPNCPAGAATIADFKATYPDNVVSVAYHSPPNFTEVRPTSIYDFKRDEAADIQSAVGGAFGKPSAAFNRQVASNNFVWNGVINSWAAAAQVELDKPATFLLDIENTYNEGTRALTCTVVGTPLASSEDNYFIHVMILENDIIDAQLDQATDILDYEHDHVFHKLLTNSVNGEAFSSGVTEGTEISKTYNFILPVESDTEPVPWIPENCEIIAFITNGDGVVEQAAEAHVTE